MSHFSPLRLPYCSLIPPFIVSKNPWRGWSPRIFHWALVPHQNKWYGWLRTDEQMCFFHWFLQVPDVFFPDILWVWQLNIWGIAMYRHASPVSVSMEPYLAGQDWWTIAVWGVAALTVDPLQGYSGSDVWSQNEPKSGCVGWRINLHRISCILDFLK